MGFRICHGSKDFEKWIFGWAELSEEKYLMTCIKIPLQYSTIYRAIARYSRDVGSFGKFGWVLKMDSCLSVEKECKVS